jgi:hypothetical protein
MAKVSMPNMVRVVLVATGKEVDMSSRVAAILLDRGTVKLAKSAAAPATPRAQGRGAPSSSGAATGSGDQGGKPAGDAGGSATVRKELEAKPFGELVKIAAHRGLPAPRPGTSKAKLVDAIMEAAGYSPAV